jgi:ADP-heptose:LPS heptosyltransferase
MAAAKSVLVICMRRIGDVLLATPVARSIRRVA